MNPSSRTQNISVFRQCCPHSAARAPPSGFYAMLMVSNLSCLIWLIIDGVLSVDLAVPLVLAVFPPSIVPALTPLKALVCPVTRRRSLRLNPSVALRLILKVHLPSLLPSIISLLRTPTSNNSPHPSRATSPGPQPMPPSEVASWIPLDQSLPLCTSVPQIPPPSPPLRPGCDAHHTNEDQEDLLEEARHQPSAPVSSSDHLPEGPLLTSGAGMDHYSNPCAPTIDLDSINLEPGSQSQSRCGTPDNHRGPKWWRRLKKPRRDGRRRLASTWDSLGRALTQGLQCVCCFRVEP